MFCRARPKTFRDQDTLACAGRSATCERTLDEIPALQSTTGERIMMPLSRPQLCSCGNRERLIDTTTTPGFNGAATLQLRKPVPVPQVLADVVAASMGPQLCSCGNTQSRYELCEVYLASMGPQLCSCGNTQSRYELCEVYLASMGPQLCSCGNTQSRYELCEVYLASMGPQLCSCGNPSPFISPATHAACFNGAATLQLRKQADSSVIVDLPQELQWGRNFAVAETRSRSDGTIG